MSGGGTAVVVVGGGVVVRLGGTAARATPSSSSRYHGAPLDGVRIGGRIVVLVLIPDKDHFFDVISSYVRTYGARFGGACDFKVCEVMHDDQIKEAVRSYDPSIVVTTGSHWMRMVMSGFCPLRMMNSDMQDLNRIHGNMLQVSCEGRMRWLFPIVGYRSPVASPCGSPPDSPRATTSTSTSSSSSSSGWFFDWGSCYSSSDTPCDDCDGDQKTPLSIKMAVVHRKLLDPTLDSDMNRLMECICSWLGVPSLSDMGGGSLS